MRLHFMVSSCVPALLAGAVVSSNTAGAASIDDYQAVRTFQLPTPNAAAGGNVVFSALPDGRLMALNGSDVSIESSVDSGKFNDLGNVAGFNAGYGASFFSISPDGLHAAAGSNDAGFVTVFSTSNPSSATNFTANDFDGKWIDNRYLAIESGESGPGVAVLDTTANPASAVKTVITGVNGASAGVGIDAAGNIYTGNGFGQTPGTSQTGWIKEFNKSAWQAALAGTTGALNFETTGTPVARLLTADPIVFDNSGNLFVGGGDFYGGSGDVGYAAMVSASAVNSALANPQSTPPISSTSNSSVLRKIQSPQDTIDADAPPDWTYNQATGELYLDYAFGDGTVTVFAVPEPATGLLLVSMGVMLTRRRRSKGGRRSNIDQSSM